MKLTPEIIKALKDAIENLGSASELSRKSGVNHRSISQYLSSKKMVRKIELETWLKLEPFLRPYMNTEQRVAVFHPGAEGKGKEPQTAAEGIENDPNLTPREKKRMLLHLKEIELDRKFGITDDESEGHNPTSGAVAG